MNLTPRIVAAASRSGDYDLSRLLKQLSDSFAREGMVVDWDDGAGEDWARVFVGGRFADGRMVAIIWRRGPLAFVVLELAGSVVSLLEQRGLDVLLIASFDEATYDLDESAIPVLLGTAPWPQVVPKRGLSIRDLWWATV